MAESAAAVGTQIGRYFSLASLLPSALFIVWLLALQGAASPFAGFDPDGAVEALTSWSLEKTGIVLGASLLLGLVVHPLLFATTQLLEGYWGPRPFAVRLAAALALRHRARQHRLEERSAEVGRQMRRELDESIREEIGEAEFARLAERVRERRAIQSRSPEGAAVHDLVIARDAMKKVLAEMPRDADRLLPTRLGNALRRVEDSVGSQYGLRLITVAPHLAVSAAPSRMSYIDDAREQMDVSIRLSFFGLAATVITTVWLLGAGWWLLLALVPYAFAYLTYRGAVAAAGEWGAAMAACMDLDRFTMYDLMNVERPTDTDAEGVQNAALMRLLQGQHVFLRYRREAAGEPGRPHDTA
ncbi:hypothetical protein Q760_10230 [Cellulomonas cellasea DSM 20118]|uniref:Uncharacterized protein n=2 Tax=Cellulomonas cellasea TaxID=43670 RepID=A0A0A0BD69_9CELL|nr:hypothetical protein Q760_10230 [Cellulomonas cellasea DSM 20118]